MARARAHRASSRPPAPRSRGTRRLAALVIAALAAVTLVASPAAPAVAAPLNVTESFTGTSVADPAWRTLGAACLTRATVAPHAGQSGVGVCASRTGAPASAATPGSLQLTDNTVNSSGGIVYDTPLPVSGGLDVRFDQFQYGQGTNGNEGIAFFLADGSRPVAQIGGGAGSLGYAQTTARAGIDGAYLGVGLDSGGSFSVAADGRGTGCAQVAPGSRPNAVALRGAGQGGTGYCYLSGSGLGTSRQLHAALPSSSNAAPPGTAGRTIRVQVSNAALPVVTVSYGASAGLPDAQLAVVHQYTMTTSPPASVKLGFTATTGTLTDTHLIQNVRIASVAPTSGVLQLTKTLDPAFAQASYAEGQDVRYRFSITAPQLLSVINDVQVADPLVPSVQCSANAFLLAGTITCTGAHRVTAQEAMQGSLVNTAVASGQPVLSSRLSSNADSVSVPITRPSPLLALTKVGTLTDTNVNGVADAGERIAYSFIARNSGNVTLQGVAVTDPRVTGVAPATATLAPGASQTFTSTAYTVTAADVAAGTPISNTATVTGRTLAGQEAPAALSTVTTPVRAAGAITLTKDASLVGGSVPGATVTYTLRATNTGGAAMTGVTIADPLAGLSAMAYTWPGTAGTLAVGASVTATATYSVKQSDVDAGQIANTATASGTLGRHGRAGQRQPHPGPRAHRHPRLHEDRLPVERHRGGRHRDVRLPRAEHGHDHAHGRRRRRSAPRRLRAHLHLAADRGHARARSCGDGHRPVLGHRGRRAGGIHRQHRDRDRDDLSGGDRHPDGLRDRHRGAGSRRRRRDHRPGHRRGDRRARQRRPGRHGRRLQPRAAVRDPEAHRRRVRRCPRPPPPAASRASTRARSAGAARTARSSGSPGWTSSTTRSRAASTPGTSGSPSRSRPSTARRSPGRTASSPPRVARR